jgi:hypothetical protein
MPQLSLGDTVEFENNDRLVCEIPVHCEGLTTYGPWLGFNFNDRFGN